MVWFLNNYVDERWAWAEIFTKEECQEIISIGELLNPTDGVLTDSTVKYDIRKSKVSWLNTKDHRWIYERCTNCVNDINNRFFNYDLTYIEELQFTKYNSNNDFYGKHIDNSYNSTGSRKLSFSILLSEPDEYSGGDLALHYEPSPVYAKKVLGTMIAFPSWMLHEVTPVTSGIRYSLVGWCCGPRFR